MIIDKIFVGGEKVKSIDFATDILLLIDLEQLPEGHIVGGRFILGEYVSALDEDGHLFNWGDIVQLKSFIFKGKDIDIHHSTDPEVGEFIDYFRNKCLITDTSVVN